MTFTLRLIRTNLFPSLSFGVARFPLRRFHLFAASWGGNAQKNQNSASQPEDVLVREKANPRSNLGFRNGCDLIHHQPTDSAQAIGLAWLDK